MIQYDKNKFRELLLYVAERSENDPLFGATKLNKILFFSDFLFYGDTGKSITGATYQRLDHGPAPRELLPVQKELLDNEEAFLHQTGSGKFTKKKLLALRSPDLRYFAPEEIAMVDKIISALRAYNAGQVSDLSHLMAIGWEIAGDREDIPYQSVFLSSDKPTTRDLERGVDLAKEHGFVAA